MLLHAEPLNPARHLLTLASASNLNAYAAQVVMPQAAIPRGAARALLHLLGRRTAQGTLKSCLPPGPTTVQPQQRARAGLG